MREHVHENHNSFTATVVRILGETGHDALCIGEVAFELLEQYTRNIVFHTQGDPEAMANCEAELRRLLEQVLREMRRFHRERFPEHP